MRLTTTTMILLLAVLASAAHAQSTLMINEVLAGPARDWDGSGALSTRDDEWVEILNNGPAPIDLAGYLITDGDNLPRMGLTGVLGPGAVVLVFGSQSVEWERANGQPVFGLSLGNTGDSVKLWQVVGADTVLVDAYTYPAHAAAADRAVGRAFGGGTWMLFDGLNPYGGTTVPVGTGCMPSPGGGNPCGVTPTRAVTWGRLKAMYR